MSEKRINLELAEKFIASSRHRLTPLMQRLAISEIKSSRTHIEKLEAALRPFAFIDMGKDEDEGAAYTTQEVWEVIYRDRVKDWISCDDIEAVRKALEQDT